MTYICHCGNTLFIFDGYQTCNQCGSIYRLDPMIGGVARINCCNPAPKKVTLELTDEQLEKIKEIIET